MCLWQTNMQISAAFIENNSIHYISANIADNWQNNISSQEDQRTAYGVDIINVLGFAAHWWFYI